MNTGSSQLNEGSEKRLGHHPCVSCIHRQLSRRCIEGREPREVLVILKKRHVAGVSSIRAVQVQTMRLLAVGHGRLAAIRSLERLDDELQELAVFRIGCALFAKIHYGLDTHEVSGNELLDHVRMSLVIVRADTERSVTT